MTDTPDDPPWLTGPPPGYEPPPVDDLRDPAVRDETHHRGAEAVRQALAELGLTKQGGRWVRGETTTEGERL